MKFSTLSEEDLLTTPKSTSQTLYTVYRII